MSWLFGGGDSTTSVEIPGWIKDIVEPLLGNTAALYGQWQAGGADQMMPGWTPWEDPSKSAYKGGGGGGGAQPKQEPPRGADPNRQTPATAWWNMDPNNGWGDWTAAGNTGNPMFEAPEEGFWGDATRPVYGPSPWEEMGASVAPRMEDESGHYQLGLNQLDRLQRGNWQENAMQDLALDWGKTMGEEEQAINRLGSSVYEEAKTGASTEGLLEDPRTRAYVEAFEGSMKPMLANMAEGMGLGRSGVLNAATGHALTQNMLPVLQDVMASRERQSVRKGQALSEQAGRFMELGGRKRGARTEALQTLGELGGRNRRGVEQIAQARMGLGDREQQRKQQALDALMGVGERMRGIRQEQSDEKYNEWLRKAAAFESAIGGPLGMIPSTFGSRSSSDKKSGKF